MSRSKHTKKRTAAHVALAIVIICPALAVSATVAGLLFYKQAQTVEQEEQQVVSALLGLNGDVLKKRGFFENRHIPSVTAYCGSRTDLA